MYLTICTSNFSDDEVRVTFALSYLKGSLQDWFKSEISHVASEGGKLPKWFNDYTVFQQELKCLFRLCDPITDAMSSLGNLRYRDSGKMTCYTITFNLHPFPQISQSLLANLLQVNSPTTAKSRTTDSNRVRKIRSNQLQLLWLLLLSTKTLLWTYSAQMVNSSKPKERQQHLDNKLCLRCGKLGHRVNDCPTKSKPKG